MKKLVIVDATIPLLPTENVANRKSKATSEWNDSYRSHRPRWQAQTNTVKKRFLTDNHDDDNGNSNADDSEMALKTNEGKKSMRGGKWGKVS